MMLIVSALPWFSQEGLELEEKEMQSQSLAHMQGVAGFRDTNLVGRLRIVQLIGLSAATVQGEGRRLSLSLIHAPIVAQLGLLGAWKSILAKNDYDGNVLMRGGVLEECGKRYPWGFQSGERYAGSAFSVRLWYGLFHFASLAGALADG
jgi:hypothetical protein